VSISFMSESRRTFISAWAPTNPLRQGIEMYDFITQYNDAILFILLVIIGLLGYNWGHHTGYIKGFRNGRRAGLHPTRKARS
jgi:hypothetical protein